MIQYVLYEQFIQKRSKKLWFRYMSICFIQHKASKHGSVSAQNLGSTKPMPAWIYFCNPTDVNASLLTDLPINKLLDWPKLSVVLVDITIQDKFWAISSIFLPSRFDTYLAITFINFGIPFPRSRKHCQKCVLFPVQEGHLHYHT